MKRTICLLMSLSLLAWTLQGCSDDNKTQTPPAPEPEISFPTGSDTQPVFATEGGTSTLTFTASEAWTASVGEANTRAIDWLSVSPTSGQAGTATLTIQAEPNDTPDERNAAITLTCGNARETLTVTQKQKDALTVTSNKVELEAEGGDFAIELQANVSVTYEIAEDAQSWLTPASDTRALTTTTLRFHAATNEDLQPRQGVITLNGGNGLTEKVTVYQAGSGPVLVLTQKEYLVGSEGETIQVELKSNNTYQIEMPSVDWITEADTRALSTYTHYFIVSPNETYDSREAVIRFVDQENGLEQTVTVTQMQRDAIVVAQSTYEIGAEGGTLDFAVQANVDFTVSTDADWITQAETRGLTEHMLHFDVAANESEEAREATITLSSENDGIEQVIKVHQKGKSSLQLSTYEYTAGVEGGTFEIDVRSNIAYQMIMPDVDWIVNTITHGDKYTFEVLPNDTYDARTAEIRFVCEEENLTQTVTVTQKQQDAFVVAQSIYEIDAEGGTLDFAVQANVDFTVSTDADWITQAETRGLTEHMLHFDVAANESEEAREATITLSSENDGIEQVIKVHQKGKSSLQLSTYEYTAGVEGGTFEIDVRSNIAYQMIMPDVDWIVNTITHGDKYTFEVLPNDTYDARTAEIRFVCEEEDLTQTVTVTQKQQDAIITAQDFYEVEAEGGTLDIPVQANIDFTVSTDADWITQTETRGLTEHVLHFDVAANESEEAREATVTLRSESAGIEQAIKVRQEGKSSLQLSIYEYTAGAGAEIFEVYVQSNAAYRLEMPDVDWLINITANGDFYQFEVRPNETYDARTAEIRFVCEEEDLTQTVTVTQKQQDAIITAQDFYEVEAEGGTLNIPVQANVDFTVSTNADWITQIDTSTKGLIEKVLKFNIEANSTLNSREAIITLTANNGIQQDILVKQSGVIPFIKITSSPTRISKEAQDIAITVESNIDYYFMVESDVEWIFYRDAYPNQIIDGIFTSTHTFGVSDNRTSDIRSGHITFFIEEYNIRETITIEQDGQVSIAPDIDDIINSEW